MPVTDELLKTLRTAQRLGFFGAGDVGAFVKHAQQFVAAIDDVEAGASLIDLGSGGGLPGLVVAAERPDLDITLVDRREKRTDFLELAVRRLGLAHVTVQCGDVDNLRTKVSAGRHAPFTALTARGFGPPEYFVACAIDLLIPGGVAVISDPPGRNRWASIAHHGLEHERWSGVSRFRRSG